MKNLILGFLIILLLLPACTAQQSVSAPTSANSIPPFFTDVTTYDVLESTVSIHWHSTNTSLTKIEYGVDSFYGFIVNADIGSSGWGGTDLRKLSPGTTYHFRLIGIEQNGNQSFSKDYTFITLTSKSMYSARLFPFISPMQNSSSLLEEHAEVMRLNTNFFNNSNQPITVTKVEFLYKTGEVACILPFSSTGSGNENISFTLGRSDLPEVWNRWLVASGDSLFTGIEWEIYPFFSDLEGWAVIWYLTDINGVEARAIGSFSLLP